MRRIDILGIGFHGIYFLKGVSLHVEPFLTPKKMKKRKETDILSSEEGGSFG